MSPHQSWSIIVFAFNEEGSILGILEKAYDIINKVSPEGGELIIVDDGSTDKTPSLIKEFLQNKSNIITVTHRKNKGIGPALTSGYKIASKENVCAIPGDGQFNPYELIPFATIPEHTIVSFYRQKKTLYSPFRKLLTYCNRFLNRCILGITIRDVNWIKVYKNEDLKKTNLAITSSLVESEICAKMLLKNHQLIEVKSDYGVRLSGKPKGASYKIIKKALSDVFILYCEIRRYKKKVPTLRVPQCKM